MKILHEGQVEIDIDIVKNLIKNQFPEYEDLSIYKFDSSGTVNAIFKLGAHYYVRLPLIKEYADSLLKEYKILPYLSKKLTIEIPQPIKLGVPGNGYPFHWAVYKWIDGESYNAKKIINFQGIISELANFITELHNIDLLDDCPKAGRLPLSELHTMTMEALDKSKEEIDYKKTIKIWEKLIDTPAWDKKPVWIHADLLKSNILIQNNHITAIIDFGSAGAGDPAFDIIPAWAIFDNKSRNIFRKILNVDDTVWNRACAYALHQAALGIPYYRESNPRFVKQSVYTINEIIMAPNGF